MPEPSRRQIINLLLEHKEKDFVKRILRKEDYPELSLGKGETGTHLMATGEAKGRYFAYPEITHSGGELTRRSGAGAFYHALSAGEFIEFESPEEAEQFSKSYKKAWEEPSGDPIEMLMRLEKKREPAPWRDLFPALARKYFKEMVVAPIKSAERAGDVIRGKPGAWENITWEDIMAVSTPTPFGGVKGGLLSTVKPKMRISREEAIRKVRGAAKTLKKYQPQEERVQPLMRALERGIQELPQRELDRIERLAFRALKTAHGTWSPVEGMVTIDPFKHYIVGKGVRRTLFHEAAHARQIPYKIRPPDYRRKADIYAGGERKERVIPLGGTQYPKEEVRAARGLQGLMEQMVAEISRRGIKFVSLPASKKPSKYAHKTRFYWDNPKEILARTVADKVLKHVEDLPLHLDPTRYRAVRFRDLPISKQKAYRRNRLRRAKESSMPTTEYLHGLQPEKDMWFVLEMPHAGGRLVGMGITRREAVEAAIHRASVPPEYIISKSLPQDVYDKLYNEALRETLTHVWQQAPRVFRWSKDAAMKSLKDWPQPKWGGMEPPIPSMRYQGRKGILSQILTKGGK